MRVDIFAILRPSPGASRHPLPEGEGHLRNRSAYAWPFRSPRWHWIYAGHDFVIWTVMVYDRRRSVSATSPAVIDRRYSSTNQILSQTAQRGLHLRIVWIQALKEKVMFQ